MMNRCEDKHEPKYKITYKPAKGNDYCPVWLVCEPCYEKRPFGSDEYVHSVEILSSKITA
jgi:hypothetical protein